MLTDNTPVLVAAAQVVLRDIETAEQTRSPVELAASAVSKAVADVETLAGKIDALVMARTYLDSSAAMKPPFGNSTKPPVSVARLAGLSPRRMIYGPEGGQSPQRLANEFAEAIYHGECSAAVICGAEATAASKQAQRSDWQLDWHEDPAGDVEDRGFKALWDDVELRHHITFPPQVYAVFENAWRHKQGLSVAEHRKLMGKLFARFSEIAAKNPYSQFPVERSAEFLATPSKENYIFNEPYNKWMVAQDAVNQAAALVLTSVGMAREMGIPESRWVFLHGYADADDTFVSRRADLSSSIAMKAATSEALRMADKTIADIELLDIYSCFPIAVLAACEALGIPWDGDRDLTVTGGLPFFGGPGNSYSAHAIAEMYERLVKQPGTFGLISANGGFLTKQSVGVYSTTASEDWEPAPSSAAQAMVDETPQQTVLYPYEGEALVESYSLVYKKSVPKIGFVLAREPGSGQRVLAQVAREDDATRQEMVDQEPIGRTVKVTMGEKAAFFRFC